MSENLEILPNVKYRIQSIDRGTFLERRGKSVILRQLKEDSKGQEASPPSIKFTLPVVTTNQQWTFIRRDDSDVYEIRNLIGSDSWSLSNSQVGGSTNKYTGTVEDPILAVNSNNTSEKYWRLILKSPGSTYDF